MYNRPSDAVLAMLPALYASEHVPAKDKIIHLHFMFGDSDWFAVEFDGDDLLFGFAVLNGDLECAEWGYFSLAELESITLFGCQVVNDPMWKPTPAGKIEHIRELI